MIISINLQLPGHIYNLEINQCLILTLIVSFNGSAIFLHWQCIHHLNKPFPTLKLLMLCIKLCNWLSIAINKMDKSKRSIFPPTKKTNFKSGKSPSEETYPKRPPSCTRSTSTAYVCPRAAAKQSTTAAFIPIITTRKTSIPKSFTRPPTSNSTRSTLHYEKSMCNREL